MMRSLVGRCSFLLACMLAAGCASVNLKEGKKAYDELRYADAIWYFEKGLAKKDDPESRALLANAYRITGQPEKAVKEYSQSNVTPGTTDSDKVNYARMLMSEGNYSEARNVLDGVLSRDKTNQEAQSLLLSCKKQDVLRGDSIMYSVAPVNIPTAESVYSPVVYGDGLLITQPRASGDKDPYTNKSFTDIFFTSQANGAWTEPMALRGVNSPWHDASPVLSPNGQIMVFTRNFVLLGKTLGSNDQRQSTTQLYMSRKGADGEWGKAELLPFCDARYMFAHPAFTPDGSELYFASDMADSQGGLDLYASRYTDGSWGQPRNLGNDVNTRGDECFPTMRHADTLYFSSDAHETLGGLDLLFSVRREGSFKRPNHLSYPINSQRDDFGLVFNGPNRGYLSSDRSGSDRIYSFLIEKPRVLINGLVTGEQSMLPLGGVQVTVVNITDGTEEIVFTDGDGMYQVPVEPGKEYKVETELEGYFREVDEVSTKGVVSDKVITNVVELKEVFLTPPSDKQTGENTTGGVSDAKTGSGQKEAKPDTGPGKADKTDKPDKKDKPGKSTGSAQQGTYPVPNIYWDYNKWDIRSDAIPYLDDLVKLFRNNQNLRFEIRSHCDCRGSDEYNIDLSDKRAKAVADYLVAKGVPRYILTSKGFGETELVNECDDGIFCEEPRHEQNRRTEFIVTDKK